MAKKRSRSSGCAPVLLVASVLLIALFAAVALLNRAPEARSTERDVVLTVAYSPDKGEVYEQLARRFAEKNPRLPNGKRATLQLTALGSEQMVEVAQTNQYHAVSPDSSLWLAEIDRQWSAKQGQDVALVGNVTRAMVSPVVIAMWREVATQLGYPAKELGWQDVLRAAENPQFKWSHPSANTASGLLATLAIFYAGAGAKRDLSREAATAQSTIDYVARLEKTVKHYGEGEIAVMEQVAQRGRAYLDAFVLQERMVVRYNQTRGGTQLVAIYPVEGTLWADHPLALLEHPQRTDDERLVYGLFKDFLLLPETQQFILQEGYRPTDLRISLSQQGSPIAAAYGADPTRPYTTLQVPGPSVVEVVRSSWQYTKRRTNIYLVADVSASMEGAKLRDAKEALKVFLAQVQGDQERIGLVVFSSTASEAVPLTQLGQGRQRLQASIDGLATSGNTAMLDAVDLALTKLQALKDTERINAIVVMTDGKENRSRTRLNDLVAKLRRTSEAQVPVVVFCIAYGSDADYQMLEAISNATGGFTRRGDLETIKNLYKTLSTYF